MQNVKYNEDQLIPAMVRLKAKDIEEEGPKPGVDLVFFFKCIYIDLCYRSQWEYVRSKNRYSSSNPKPLTRLFDS